MDHNNPPQLRVSRCQQWICRKSSLSRCRGSMEALPAVDLLKKFVEPPSLKIDTAPAVALLENLIVPGFPEASATVVNVCSRPEIFVMPTPLTVSVNPALTLMP